MGRLRGALAGLAALLMLAPAGVLPATATPPGDNGRIAFRRFLNQEQTWGAVFTIKPNGRGDFQVTHPPAGYVDRNPDVSPDGRRVVFEREGVDCDCSYAEIFVADVDGSHLKQLTHDAPGCDLGGACNGSPAWSPDGRRIVFSRAMGPVENDIIEDVGLWSMAADGSDVRQLTQLARPGAAEDTDPQFSPDGRYVVFQRVNVRTEPLFFPALFTLDLVTGAERRITAWELRAGDTPDWSPDGSRILFHDNLDGPSGVSANLYTVRPDGSHLTKLTFETGGHVNYLGSSWSPDGSRIVVGRRPGIVGTNADILIFKADATHPRWVTRTQLYDSYPDWGPAVDDQ